METSHTNTTTNNNNNNNSYSPYVCLSAHCDLLHFVGPVPHPYGGPSPQTIKDRAARCVRFKCESLEKPPSITVECEHALFPSISISTDNDGNSYFPLSGVSLARWAFKENFESSSLESGKLGATTISQQKDKKEEIEEDITKKTCETLVTSPTQDNEIINNTNTITGGGNKFYFANPFSLRRTILQTLLILNLPKRSPAASFKFSMHDPNSYGVTSFFVLPRSAEQISILAYPVKINLKVNTVLKTEVLPSSSSSSSSSSEKMEILQCSCFPNNNNNYYSTEESLLWILGINSEEKQSNSSLQISSFITDIMIPSLFSIPNKLLSLEFSKGEESKKKMQIVSWSQRRSFQFLALVAHCIWCEKVSWYIINTSNSNKICSGRFIAYLKPRDEASLESSEKWETILIFNNFIDDTSSKNNGVKLIQVSLRGCDEEMEWKWNNGLELCSSRGVLSSFNEMVLGKSSFSE